MSTSLARAGELVHAALGLDESARAELLERIAHEDATLAREVGSLLAAHLRADERFLLPPDSRGRRGTRAGDFTLLEELGTGGMGTVYVAHQAHPPRRVALKLARQRPGLDSRRLELEAEAMARLSHPDIARVFAAGTLEEPGGPLTWVALELVEDARSLGAHCRGQGLGRNQRLDLFERLCAAVLHGHQQGVVHCDLKLDNVLVDGRGALKVIDFGIARLTDGLEAGRGRAGEISGSLATMSPEQARGEVPDAQSDVYALGAVLCELLTDRPPLDLARLPLDEALRRIQEEEPVSPGRCAAGIPRELDAIVGTALAKDRARRYAGVHALAEDLRRFRAHEPIRAEPPGPLRRLDLFVRRHRLLVGAAAAILVVAVLASVVSLRFALRALQAGEREHVARVRAERLTDLQRSLFASARPRVALGRDVTVRELLDDARFHAERTLAREPTALGELQATLAQTYNDLGEYGTAVELFESSLTRLPADARPAARAARLSALAHAHLERAELERAAACLDGARVALARDNQAPLELVILTEVRTAELLRRRGCVEEGRAVLDGALILAEGLAPHEDLLRARILAQLAELLRGRGDLAQAADLGRQALELQRARLPAAHPLIAATENSLANVLFELGQMREAEALWRSALATFERVLAPTHPDLVTVLANLSLVHQQRREFELAQDLLERALDLRRSSLGDQHPRTRMLLRRLSDLNLAAGQTELAVERAAEALEIERSSLEAGSDPIGLEQALFGLALAEQAAGALEAASAHLAESLALQSGRLDPEHLDLAQGRTLLGSLLLKQGRAEEALEPLEQAVAVRRGKLPGHWLTANTENLLGAALLARGEVERAAPLLRESVPVLERALGAEDYRTREARVRAAQLP
jgi:tetratricopeptide (TPR) repeat protein